VARIIAQRSECEFLGNDCHMESRTPRLRVRDFERGTTRLCLLPVTLCHPPLPGFIVARASAK
jgi:hypothetical protein